MNEHVILQRLDKMELLLEKLIKELASGGRQHIAVAVDSMKNDIEMLRRDTTYIKSQWQKMSRTNTWPGDPR